MPYPPISALPAVPSRNAPSTFSALMDAFLAAFPIMRTEINALAAYLDTLALATGPGLFQNGSAATPGISWALDTNTGLFRPAAGQIGFATGGTQRALLSAAGLQVDVPMIGSAVTQNATDATAGRLLKVGDGGMLGMPPSAPANINVEDNSIPRGVWMYAPSSVVTTGLPAPLVATSSENYIFHHRRVSGGEIQLLINEWNSATPRDSTLWVRTRTVGAWGAWRRVYDFGNILGPVSQSGGVPTGGVMYRGSNANGEYVQFADGTQICTRSFDLGSVVANGSGTFASPFHSNPATVVFAASFITPPALSFGFPVVPGVGVAGRALAPAGYDVTVSAISSFRVARLSGETTPANAVGHLTAIGRWF